MWNSLGNKDTENKGVNYSGLYSGTSNRGVGKVSPLNSEYSSR